MKAIFLDRDGTINVDTGYTHKLEDFRFKKNAVEGLQLLQKSGYKFIILTNQSGIARGFYEEKDFWKFNNHLVDELKKQGIKIIKTYFSPFHPEKGIGKYKKETDCRKPRTGLLKQAADDFRVNIAHSWMIGDKWSDVQCGNNFGIKSILIRTEKHVPKREDHQSARYIAQDLLDAARFIISTEKNGKQKNKI